MNTIEALPDEVFIVGYRYRDNADDVSKLFKLNRPIEKNDIIEVFGDDSAFLKPVESDIDPYCVAVTSRQSILAMCGCYRLRQ